MAKTATKELLIEYELKFLEKKLKELKKYIEARPIHKIDDRSYHGGGQRHRVGRLLPGA